MGLMKKSGNELDLPKGEFITKQADGVKDFLSTVTNEVFESAVSRKTALLDKKIFDKAIVERVSKQLVELDEKLNFLAKNDTNFIVTFLNLS